MDDQSNGRKRSMEKQSIELIDVSTCGWLESLPIEVTQKILEKLPVTSLVCCKLLSKSFPSILNDQLFALNHFLNAAKTNPFLFISYKNSLYFLDLASPEVSALKRIQIPFQMSDFYIGGSCNGYLCLSTSSRPGNSPYQRSYPYGSLYDDVTFTWNPFTSHFLELPSSPKRLSWAFGFGFHPQTKKHKVVKMYDDTNSHGNVTEKYMQILTLGTDHWTTLKAPSNVKTRALLRTKNRGVCVNGLLRWIGKKYEEQDMFTIVILALDLASEEVKEIPLPDNIESERCENLMEISGCLALVVLNKEHLEIWVMKDYDVKDSWTLQFVIGNYAERVAEQLLVKKSRGEIVVTGGFHLNLDDLPCFLKDDKLLIQFTVGGILCYDFRNERFMDFNVGGLPNLRGYPYEYEAIALTGSLICIN